MANTFTNTFTVGNIHIVGTPTVQNVFNEFDEFGLLIGISRFTGENIESFKKRLADTYINRANSTYTGLVNGITRELGLNLYSPIRIYPIKSAGLFVAEDPVIIFKGPYVELWRNKQQNILEMEIERFSESEDTYLVRDLVAFINSRSIYFRASMDVDNFTRSMCILNQTNIRQIKSEIVPQSEIFTLRYPGINGGAIQTSSVVFNDSFIFQRLVPNVNSVINDGDYYINSYTGNVTVSNTPTPNTLVQYNWIDYDFKPVASPVIIHDIESPNFKRKMFQQVLGDDGIYRNGMPTEFGAEIINELLSYYPLYNGV